LPDHLKQTSAGVEVMFVRLEVIRYLGDSPGQYGHLDIG
jgi:hypothetical protein